MAHTHGHGDSMTEWVQWGRFREEKNTQKNDNAIIAINGLTRLNECTDIVN